MLENNLEKIVPIFNLNRIKILGQLYKCQTNVCGCDMVDNIQIPKNLLSYHISFLEKEGLIEEQRCGQRKNYRLTKKGIKFIKLIQNIQQIF